MISDEAVIGLYTVPILLIGVLTTVIIYICYIVIGVKVMWTSVRNGISEEHRVLTGRVGLLHNTAIFVHFWSNLLLS